MERKCSLLLFSLFLVAFYSILLAFALWTPYPSSSNPLILYSNQTRDDFKLLLQKGFRKAQTSIDLFIYSLTDRCIIDRLCRKADEAVTIHITHDRRSGSRDIPHKAIVVNTPKLSGLMHRKIILIDRSYVFLGSANMTPTSLTQHDNLSVGIYNPGLAAFIKEEKGTVFDFTLDQRLCKFWFLPDPQALPYLINQIQNSRSSIFVAMFTLTHPDLLKALSQAHYRGVEIKVAIDGYTARGASRKAIEYLKSHGIKVLYSQGLKLLHYKWAWIDQDQLILGSTNWTKAAFTKNQDNLLFIQNLAPRETLFLKKLKKAIIAGSTTQLS